MIEMLLDNSGAIINVATGIVTIASIITAATPTPKPDSALGRIYRLIEVFALVVGRAKQ